MLFLLCVSRGRKWHEGDQEGNLMLLAQEVNYLGNSKDENFVEMSTNLELLEPKADDGLGKIVIRELFNRLAAHLVERSDMNLD